MPNRTQLPPQITKVGVRDRKSGKPVIRYQLVVDTGHDPQTGKRRQIRRRYATEREARKELARVQSGVVTGTYVHRFGLTLDQACAEWLAGKRYSLKASTLRGHEVKLAVLRDELGATPIQRLGKAALDTLIARLRAGEVEAHKAWSARSCNYLLSLVSCVLEDQVRQGHLVRNVARLVDRVAADPKTYRTLSAQEASRILSHQCRDRHLWALALHGLRRGEICGLRWEHVDLSAKTLRVCENRVVLGPGHVESGSPKSRTSNRVLPLPDQLAEVLRAARKRQRQERLALGEGYGSGKYVCSDEAGQPLHPDALTSRWQKLLRDLGIDYVRLHDARHSFATLAHLNGIPLVVIASWLGHSSASFTLATYAHSRPEALRSAGDTYSRVVTSCDIESGP